jgi:hypothetical protein
LTAIETPGWRLSPTRRQAGGVNATPLTVAAFDDLINRDAGRWAELRLSGAKGRVMGGVGE